MNTDYVLDDIKELLLIFCIIMVFVYVKGKKRSPYVLQIHTEIFIGEIM